MKLDKFPNRVKSAIQDFENLENQKRWRYLIKLNIKGIEKTLVVSRLEYDEEEKQAFLKYSAQSKHSFSINPKFIELISDIELEKVSVIRKKLKLRAPLKRRPVERDKFGIPIKKSRQIRKNKELSELEFKAMFSPRFITDEIRDELFLEKDLFGRMDIVKKDFKKIKPEFQEVVDEFLEKYIDLETVNEHYKRDNYGGLSLIVGKSFTNYKQQDPRFKTYKTFTVIHRDRDPFVKVIKNSVKGGTDTIYYLINEDTMVQVNKFNRWRNRG